MAIANWPEISAEACKISYIARVHAHMSGMPLEPSMSTLSIVPP